MKKLSLIMAICLLMSALIVPATAFATSNIYTTVLDDLSKDENFNISKYPVVAGDTSLDVIQIAESDAKQLFIYVYQPACKYIATSISMSTAINDNFEPFLYELKLLSRDGVFYKYLVKDFSVKTDALRYYSIVEIFREYVEGLDNKPSVDNNEIVEVSFAVGQLWTAVTVNNVVSYTNEKTEVIRITDKVVDSDRYYSAGPFFKDDPPDEPLEYDVRHFVAFTCDRPIDQLVSARVAYIPIELKVKVTEPLLGERTLEVTSRINKGLTYVTLNGEKVSAGYEGRYEWETIQSIDEFAQDEALALERMENADAILGQQWVLNFAVTKHVEKMGSAFNMLLFRSVINFEYTDITEVAILELEFVYAGETYNLGVVDNKQTPPATDLPDVADSFSSWDKFLQDLTEFWSVAKIVLMWIAIAIVGVLIIIFFKPISKIFYWLVWVVFEAVAGPFRLIILIVRLFSKKKE